MTDQELIEAVRGAAEQTMGGVANPAQELMLEIANRLEWKTDVEAAAASLSRPPVLYVTTGTSVGNTKSTKAPPAETTAWWRRYW